MLQAEALLCIYTDTPAHSLFGVDPRSQFQGKLSALSQTSQLASLVLLACLHSYWMLQHNFVTQEAAAFLLAAAEPLYTLRLSQCAVFYWLCCQVVWPAGCHLQTSGWRAQHKKENPTPTLLEAQHTVLWLSRTLNCRTH